MPGWRRELWFRHASRLRLLLFRAVRENLSIIERSRRIHVRVDDQCPDLLVDPSLALEIMVNLVENAHRVSPHEEPIILTAKRFSETQVRLEIEDLGPGIHVLPERQDDLLDLAESTTGRPGLGLEIVHGLLQALDGTLSYAHSDHGTLARVDLPAAAPESDQEQQR